MLNVVARSRPPYRDGTLYTKFYHAPAEFSSPYGDWTPWENQMLDTMWFSPPYGGCTETDPGAETVT